MKSKLLVASLLILSACGSKSSKQENLRLETIEKDIKKNALGIDIGYQPGVLDTVLVLNAGQATKDLEKEFKTPVSKDWDKAITNYTSAAEDAKTQGDSITAAMWNWEIARIKVLKTAKPTDKNFSVFKYTYHIDNMLNPKEAKVSVTNYYFFNSLDSLVGHMGDEDMDALKAKFTETKSQPYHFGLMKLETGIRD